MIITGKTLTFAALASTPGVAIVTSPAFDWNPIIAALIGAIPPTCGVVLLYWQGRKIGLSVDGVVTKLLATNTEKATAEAVSGEKDKILKLATDKATAEATIEASRLERVRGDRAAKGVVIIKSRGVRKPKRAKP